VGLEMKNKIGFIIPLILFTLISLASISAQHKFYLNLNDRTDDLFKVTLMPGKLSENNKIYQFAATAPGTYQIMDIGRYVKDFKAFDKDGKTISTLNISTNQWEISNPKSVSKIEYTIAETFDTPMDKNPVYPMCGSSLEEDHALINGQAVFGYFHGMQKYPIEIKLDYPANWTVGTALEKNSNGFYYAPSYDFVVDSPILLGNLTKASSKIESTTVDLFTYSKTGLIKSENILIALEDILSASNQFLQGLPVERYVFLFHFENFSAGAWEHNYSSIYVMKEDTLKEQYITELRSTAAHEFFHIVTPLLIHSELVENFDYEKPVMSKHLWFYEGITEWASDILQLRDYIINLNDYLRHVRQKLSINDNFDQTMSLTTLGIKSTERQDQYFNIYNKGAVVGTLLDIRLLELSKGKRGLRELILELAKKYGANKSFSEEKFFDEFVKMTYPEIGDFIKRYIDGTEKLPVKDYFEKIGIEYTENAGIDSSRIGLGFGIGFKDGKFIVANVESSQSDKLSSGDLFYKFQGQEITLQNAQQLMAPISKLKVGDSFKISILRDNQEREVNIQIQPRQIKHVFKVMENPSREQIALREAWMQNQMNYQGNMETR
jgi:predicted metalloprotease with PDZ domain